MSTLRERRQANRLTQKALANLANVSVPTIKKYEAIREPTNTPEYERVMNVIEELDRKRLRGEYPARELRIAMERAIADLGDLPNDPQVMALKAKLESIFPDVCVMVGIEEPGTLEETK